MSKALIINTRECELQGGLKIEPAADGQVWWGYVIPIGVKLETGGRSEEPMPAYYKYVKEGDAARTTVYT